MLPVLPIIRMGRRPACSYQLFWEEATGIPYHLLALVSPFQDALILGRKDIIKLPYFTQHNKPPLLLRCLLNRLLKENYDNFS